MYRQHARHQGCICGSQLGLYIRIIQGGLKKKNAWTTPSEILMKLFGGGIQESVIP